MNINGLFYPIRIISFYLNKFLLIIKSTIFTLLYVDEGKGKIIFINRYSKLKVLKDKGSNFILNNNLILDSLFIY